MSEQSKARRRATRASTRRAASLSSMTFRLSLPHGHDERDTLDWTSLQARGLVTARIDQDEQWHLVFAAPFAHLSFANGERATVEKAAELQAALRHFGVLEDKEIY